MFFSAPSVRCGDGRSGKNERVLWPAAGSAGTWARREYDASGKEKRTPVRVDGNEAVFPVHFPAPNEFVAAPGGSWLGWKRLEIVLRLPPDLPPETLLYVFTKDWDYLWRQVRVTPVREKDMAIISVPLVGAEAERAWQPCGHGRPWHALTPAQIREFGVKFDLPGCVRISYNSECRLVRAALRDRVAPDESPVRFRLIGCFPVSPKVGDVVECRSEVEAPYADPFDRAQVVVDAVVTLPDGTEKVYTGYYAEGFRFDEQDRPYSLAPQGRPYFAVRFLVRDSGVFRVRMRLQVGKKTVETRPIVVRVAPAKKPFHGCVRVDSRDRRFFSYEDGRFFEGLGINVRSPYDTRYVENAPYSAWRDEDLAIYDRLFRKYQLAGINVVEVWMCSWWLALEWIPDRVGYHGVGWMNQYNAWKLDRIFEWARRHGIYVILVFNNHGKFGTTFDREWDRNPYNRKNGGFLDDCEQFFSDARAKAAFRKFCDYTVARWGAWPNLLAWKLFTEIDLTGNSLEFYLNPVMRQWHQEMGEYVRRIDPWKHPITTHWMLSYQRINTDVADLPQLDFLTTDAYYTRGGTPEFLQLLRGSVDFLTARKKPLVITEFGGSPYGESMGSLIKQLHLGLWFGFFRPFALPPMYWWFALVDEKNLYSEFRALRNFGSGEDRRGMTYGDQRIETAGVHVHWILLPHRLLVWGYDEKWYLSPAENAPARMIENLTFALPALPAGAWDVEDWDVVRGVVAGRRQVSVSKGDARKQEGVATIRIPPFKKDFALKIILRNAP